MTSMSRARREFHREEAAVFARYRLDPHSRRLQPARTGASIRSLDVGAGEPVLFIHGISLCSAHWAPLIDRLPTWHWVALAMPGHGGSSANVLASEVACLDVLVSGRQQTRRGDHAPPWQPVEASQHRAHRARCAGAAGHGGDVGVADNLTGPQAADHIADARGEVVGSAAGHDRSVYPAVFTPSGAPSARS
jgi:pimeloyl-ACP methyl ester carboxylesterase